MNKTRGQANDIRYRALEPQGELTECAREPEVRQLEAPDGGWEPEVRQFEAPDGGWEPEVRQFEAPDGGWEPEVRQFEAPDGGWEPEVRQFEAPDGGWEPEVRQFEAPDGGWEPEVRLFEAPDGGWGWMVCFACFITHVLLDGVTYSFGILFVDFLEHFTGTNAETAWIISLSGSVCYISGPFAAALTSRLGNRSVAVIGSIVTSANLILSAFTPDMKFLYFSLGILFGTGYGMTYLPTIVCVSEYFEKRRAFATGLGVCGSGIGTFIFSPLTAVLIEMYAWRGAILIQAGLILNCLACSLVYRPLKQPRRVQQWCSRNSPIEVPTDKNKVKMQGHMQKIDSSSNEQKVMATSMSSHIMLSDTPLGEMCKPQNGDPVTDVSDVSADTCVAKVCEKNTEKPKLCHNHTNFVLSTINIIRETFSVELIRKKSFLLFVISKFLCLLGYFIPSIFLPVWSREVVTIDRVSNSLDSDETPSYLASHLDPNCLQSYHRFTSSTHELTV